MSSVVKQVCVQSRVVSSNMFTMYVIMLVAHFLTSAMFLLHRPLFTKTCSEVIEIIKQSSACFVVLVFDCSVRMILSASCVNTSTLWNRLVCKRIITFATRKQKSSAFRWYTVHGLLTIPQIWKYYVSLSLSEMSKNVLLLCCCTFYQS